MSKRIKIPVITTREEEDIRKRAVERGTDVYFAHLPEGIPDASSAESAARRAESATTEALLPAILDAISDDPPSPDRRSLLLLRMEERLPPLTLPEPELTEEIPPLRVAAAAAFGSIAGMFFLPAFTWILMDSRAAGVFIGAPLGAMLGAAAALLLPRSRRLLTGLAALLGLATAREAIRFLGGGGIFLKGWSLLRRKGVLFAGRGVLNTMKSLLLAPLLLALLLLLGRRETRFDRNTHEDAVKRALSVWTEGAARIALFAAASSAAPQEEKEETVPLLASRILSLEGASCDDLAAGVAELAVEVRNLGFSEEKLAAVSSPHQPAGLSLNTSPGEDLRWNDEIAAHYAPFGALEPGDAVRIEREPLFRNGELIAKGLVRKVRRS